MPGGVRPHHSAGQGAVEDPAAVNATRRALWEVLADTGLPGFVRRPHQVQRRAARDCENPCARGRIGEVATLVGWAVPTLDIKAS